jgi:hypothetical protein
MRPGFGIGAVPTPSTSSSPIEPGVKEIPRGAPPSPPRSSAARAPQAGHFAPGATGARPHDEHNSMTRNDTLRPTARVDGNAAAFYVASPNMRLYAGKVAVIATEVVRALVEGGDIEADAPREVQKDIESVLQQYVRLEAESSEKAKDMIHSRGLPQTDFPRLKKLVAEQNGIKLGDETLDYLLDQVVEMLMHSGNVDEVFSEDVALRRRMAPVLKRHMALDEEIEREVRAQLKHVQEGTRTWEVEYQRMSEDIKRRKGLG